MVAGANGGLVPVHDRRFDPQRDWPIRFEIEAADADLWMRYFYDQCARRGWSSGGIAQIERSENSGSISVNQGSPDKPQLAVAWERRRNRPMLVRARAEGSLHTPLSEIQTFFDEVNARCTSRVTERVYRRGTLEYYGLPWRGEYWLDETVRLGPPSLQYERAMFGPRAIVVDSLIECIGAADVLPVFDRQLREIAAFLSIVMGTNVRVTMNVRPAWSWENGRDDCAVRSLGTGRASSLPPSRPEAPQAQSSFAPLADPTSGIAVSKIRSSVKRCCRPTSGSCGTRTARLTPRFDSSSCKRPRSGRKLPCFSPIVTHSALP
jgi:hypothetical protein